ncbi:uncharacterized protein PG998_009955 [Apiospora kogelbergensis]|uniref:uncharacterized protein n=1 Tax=Apiospora kogelbergensis TaxID=1337665 RepID=UPI00312E454F
MAQNLLNDYRYFREPSFDPRVLTLGTCKFLVGPRRVEYVVHKEPLANMSPTLAAMMSTTDATGACVLEDVEEGTFAGLCEFAYTGDYFMPECQDDTRPDSEYYPDPTRHGLRAVELLGENSNSTCFEEEDRNFPHHFCDSDAHQCPGCAGENCEPGPCHKYVGFKHIVCNEAKKPQHYMKYSEFKALFVRAHKIESSEDSTQVLLHHAKLFVMGDRLKHDALKTIATHRLFRTLKEFPIVWRRIPDLVPMIRFIYCSTTKGDVLRSMVSQLTAVFAEKLMLHPEFKALLQEQTDFSYDVLQNTAESTGVTEKWIQQRRRIK